MKPLHGEICRLRRCLCCQSKHSKKNAGRLNNGKSSARHKAKLRIKKEVAELGK